MTKILSVVWYKVLPPQFGGQKGIAQFNDFLSARFPLTCICSSNNVPNGTETYTIKPVLPTVKRQVMSAAAWSKIFREAKTGHYTHVILEHCYYGLLGILIKSRLQKFLIVHSHNIEYLRFREMGKPWWPLLYWLEKKTHRAADLSLFKTLADMEFAISTFLLDPAKCLLVPFGIVSMEQPTLTQRNTAHKILCDRHGITEDAKILLFMGTLDYEPNTEAVKKIICEIIPGIRKISNLKFKVIICGRAVNKKVPDIVKLTDDDYCYAGFVDDIENYFSGANIFINPITSGGGIKVKLVEALSYGLPVVSTALAAEGLDRETIKDQLHISPGQDMEAFCRLIVASWNKPAGISEAFLAKYQWKKIVDDLAVRINQQ